MDYAAAIFLTILMAIATVGLFGLCVLCVSSKDVRDHQYSPFFAAVGLLALIGFGIMASYTRLGEIADKSHLDEGQIYVTRSSVDLGNGSYAVVLESSNNKIIAVRVSEVPPQLFKVELSGGSRKFTPIVKPATQPENPPK